MWEQWSSLARHEVIVHSALQEGYVCNSYTGMSSRHVIFCTCEVVFYDLILLIAASQDDHLSITMARTVANENSLGLVCMPAAEVMAIVRWFTPSQLPLLVLRNVMCVAVEPSAKLGEGVFHV